MALEWPGDSDIKANSAQLILELGLSYDVTSFWVDFGIGVGVKHIFFYVVQVKMRSLRLFGGVGPGKSLKLIYVWFYPDHLPL